MTDTPTSFAGHPKSLAEIRAERASDGAEWKPRDALIQLLREIDEGKADPYALVIIWAESAPKDGERVMWSSACADSIVAAGLVSRALYRMHYCATTP